MDKKNEMLKLSLEMAWSGMRDRFVDKPIEYIRESSKLLAELADTIIQEVDDSLLLQPASLDLATLKKRPGDHLVSGAFSWRMHSPKGFAFPTGPSSFLTSPCPLLLITTTILQNSMELMTSLPFQNPITVS